MLKGLSLGIGYFACNSFDFIPLKTETRSTKRRPFFVLQSTESRINLSSSFFAFPKSLDPIQDNSKSLKSGVIDRKAVRKKSKKYLNNYFLNDGTIFKTLLTNR